MLNKTSRDALKALLEQFDGNEELYLRFYDDKLPEHMMTYFVDILRNLEFEEVVYDYHKFAGGGSLYLAPKALTYFDNNVE